MLAMEKVKHDLKQTETALKRLMKRRENFIMQQQHKLESFINWPSY